MDRGVLETSELESAFRRLEQEKGGPITKVQDLLEWTIIASAIKEGVVSYCTCRSPRARRYVARERGCHRFDILSRCLVEPET